MKKIYKIAILFFAFSLFAFHSFSQDITADTTLANFYCNKARINFKSCLFDSSLIYLDKAQELIIKNFGEKSIKNSLILNYKGMVNNGISNYNVALDYFNNSLQIKKEILDENHSLIADSYNSIGTVYMQMNELNVALEYFLKSLKIRKKIFSTKNLSIAELYNNIGAIYYSKREYDLALEYFLYDLDITKELFGEIDINVSQSYSNIGAIYIEKQMYNSALSYFLKALFIQEQLLTQKHLNIATSYTLIGVAYYYINDYDNAMTYFLKSIEMQKELAGEVNKDITYCYKFIGMVHERKKHYNDALKMYEHCLLIQKRLFGNKNLEVANSYNIIGNLLLLKNNYMSSLIFYQKATASCLHYYNDTVNVYSVPFIDSYLGWNFLLQAIQSKAQIFANDNIAFDGFEVSHGMKERYKIALKHYQACDTLINQVRKEITMLSDKIALGEKANQVYNEAVEVCTKLSKAAPKDSVEYYKKLAFEYSEKNKSSVLLESLAGAQAMQFSGIPDSLLEKEHNLQIDISLYKRLLSEQPDSAQEANFRDRLFKANRNYEELIQQFEKNYTQYYNLKYGQNLANVNQLQQILDKTTAIISYQVTDSVLFIFYIEKNNYQIYTTPKRSNYQEIINVFRQSLVNTAPNNSGISKAAHFLYKQLFPFTIESHIQNLIIIPEGSMCLIPFEALLTEEYKGNLEQYSDYAYLLKKYNISYAYSASLFYRTFPKTPTKKVKVTQLNDWLAIAPVFDDVKTGGASFRTRQLLRDMERIKTDTITTRAFMLTGEYITPLPGTESEVKNIFNKFENKNKKAQIQLHAYANEAFVKSEEIKNYKYLHFASHGIVNMQKPELSGIILAQDSASGEDGILYSGEIYNLKLNADLTVLSACETGLGEIKKGEGLIGLTRALLYAGSKNIIVSLWKVADNSTSQLMVDFYDNLLKNESNNMNYSNALRQAKLKMINEGKYSHPFYWSPFILVGK